MGVALLRMVGHITIGRKAFQKYSELEQQEFVKSWEKLGDVKTQMEPLIDEDTNAFNRIMIAYKLPKDTPEEQEKRLDAIELATTYAIDVPLRLAELCLTAINLVEPIKQYGNKNALSDVGVGVLQLTAALTGALMNVKINVSGLQDEDLKTKYTNELKVILNEANTKSNQLLQSIFPNL